MVALAPYLAGIVVVVGRALLIHLFERCTRRLAGQLIIVMGLDTLQAIIYRTGDEEIKAIFVLAQDMVCAASNQNGRAAVCDLTDDVCLCQEQLVG